jgi:hypothetical protein
MKSAVLVCLLIFLGLHSRESWGSGQCTKQDLDEIESKPLAFANWIDLYISYAKYKQCDTGGGISEEYSESVVRLLDDHWNKLEQLWTLSRKHRDFKQFVLRHIDATTSDDDLKSIVEFANTKCSSGAQRLCADISFHAKAAIRESTETSSRSKP